MGRIWVAIRVALSAAVLGGAAAAAGCGESAAPPPGTPSRPAFSSPFRLPVKRSVPPPGQVRANELGQVPVLMIHQVGPAPAGDYAQTPDQLRSTLEYLATHDYVPITAAQLVEREIDIPAGTSPVVLTFDDGDPSQLRLRPDGGVDPQSAVGVVLAVAQRHPQFRPVGTMYVNRVPFGRLDARRELRWLVEHGWEVGNHTATHGNLAALPDAGVQQEIADGHRAIDAAIPGYAVTTMALPFGAMPGNPVLARRGSASGLSYHYRGVMLVGANPAPSPYAADWDPYQIPRIRSWHGRTDNDQHYWLPRLADTRYVSDGDPDKVSYPRAAALTVAGIGAAFAARANPY